MEDNIACKLIALSIGSVMRQSLDDDNFKEECKRLLGASNTHMVEEILNKKLMDLAQNGSTNSMKQPLFPVNSSTSPAVQEEPLQIEKVSNVGIQQNVPISEMYRQTIQKRSLSPQPLNGTELRLKLCTRPQSSASF